MNAVMQLAPHYSYPSNLIMRWLWIDLMLVIAHTIAFHPKVI